MSIILADVERLEGPSSEVSATMRSKQFAIETDGRKRLIYKTEGDELIYWDNEDYTVSGRDESLWTSITGGIEYTSGAVSVTALNVDDGLVRIGDTTDNIGRVGIIIEDGDASIPVYPLNIAHFDNGGGYGAAVGIGFWGEEADGEGSQVAMVASIHGAANGIHNDNDTYIDADLTVSGQTVLSGHTYIKLPADDSLPYFNIQTNGLAHGITTKLPTDAFFAIDTADSTKGGAIIYGATAEDDRVAININATRSTVYGGDGERECIAINGSDKSGTGSSAIADDSKILTINNYITEKVVVYGNGDIHTVGDISAANISAVNSITIVNSVGSGSSGPTEIVGSDAGYASVVGLGNATAYIRVDVGGTEYYMPMWSSISTS